MALVSNMLYDYKFAHSKPTFAKRHFFSVVSSHLKPESHRHELQGIDSEQANFSDMHPSRGWKFSLRYNKAGNDPGPPSIYTSRQAAQQMLILGTFLRLLSPILCHPRLTSPL